MSRSDVNVDKILGAPASEYEATYNQRDLMLYALGIGETDLQFTYEYHDKFQAFPLYPCVLPFKGSSQDVVQFPPPTTFSTPDGMPAMNPAKMLHGEQTLELYRPLDPNGGSLQCTAKVISFYDKGKGTLMETETLMKDAQGPVCRLITGSFLVGLTGFKGRGRELPPRIQVPKRAPDHCDVDKLDVHQTNLYRLSGDYNPLHIDPEVAQSVGFKEPIVHGLCTLGYPTRALFKRYCNGDVSCFKSIRVRFASPTYPGERIETRMWEEGGRVLFQAVAKDRNAVVIDGGEFIYSQKANL